MGGTIAGQSQDQRDNVGYRAGELPVAALLPAGVSSLECLAGVEVETLQVAQLDSKDMDHQTWFRLADAVLSACEDESVAGVVITHGTDTLEETAFFLAHLCVPCKPVVMTCAMRPATAISPDGPQNLVDAICVAMDDRAVGVWVVVAGAVHGPSSIVKTHPYRMDAFCSVEGGPVAVVEEGHVRWLHSSVITGAVNGTQPVPVVSRQTCAPDARLLLAELVSVGLPRVEWVVSHAGTSPDVVNVWLATQPDVTAVRGLIVVCTGNGTFHHCLAKPLHLAEAAGLLVRRSTRCHLGQIVVGTASVNWPPATPLDPVKARIALALDIARNDLICGHRADHSKTK